MGQSLYKEVSFFPHCSVGNKFSEKDLHQERQSQELHSQIVSKSDCSLPVPAFLLAISSDHQELLTKLLLVLSGQFGTHFLGQQRPSGQSFHVVHNLNNFLIIYVM